MLTAIALPYHALPLALIVRHCLDGLAHERGGERELQFHFAAAAPLLPLAGGAAAGRALGLPSRREPGAARGRVDAAGPGRVGVLVGVWGGTGRGSRGAGV
jgi:hypothetical protein